MRRIEATLALDGGVRRLHSPAVGAFSPLSPSRIVAPGDPIGELDVLGRRVRVVVPAGVHGVFVADDASAAWRDVDFGAPLGHIASEVASADAESATEVGHGAAVFRSPSSGRYYSRPGPDKPPFVEIGAALSPGDVVCLLEVMKTFNRIHYDGSLPAGAVVERVLPVDGDDLEAGDVILELRDPG